MMAHHPTVDDILKFVHADREIHRRHAVDCTAKFDPHALCGPVCETDAELRARAKAALLRRPN